MSEATCCICGNKVPKTIAALIYEIMRAPDWWKENVNSFYINHLGFMASDI